MEHPPTGGWQGTSRSINPSREDRKGEKKRKKTTLSWTENIGRKKKGERPLGMTDLRHVGGIRKEGGKRGELYLTRGKKGRTARAYTPQKATIRPAHAGGGKKKRASSFLRKKQLFCALKTTADATKKSEERDRKRHCSSRCRRKG